MEENHFYVLGINKHADLNKVKKAYRAAARRYHPGDPEPREGSSTENQGDTAVRGFGHSAAPSSRLGPGGISWDAEQYYSYTDELVDGYVPGFFDRHIDREKDFYIDLILTPAEAIEGGYLPIQMPLMITCPRCAVSEFNRRSECPLCGGFGRIETSHSFSLYIPPGAHNGTEEILYLDEVGLRGSVLHLNVIISDH